jgi:hypothetical protein
MIYNLRLWGWQNNGMLLELGTVSIYNLMDANGSLMQNWEWNGYRGKSDGGTWSWDTGDTGRVIMSLTSNISKSVISNIKSWQAVPPTPFFLKNAAYNFNYLGVPQPPVAAIFLDVL